MSCFLEVGSNVTSNLKQISGPLDHFRLFYLTAVSVSTVLSALPERKSQKSQQGLHFPIMAMSSVSGTLALDK